MHWVNLYLVRVHPNHNKRGTKARFQILLTLAWVKPAVRGASAQKSLFMAGRRSTTPDFHASDQSLEKKNERSI